MLTPEQQKLAAAEKSLAGLKIPVLKQKLQKQQLIQSGKPVEEEDTETKHGIYVIDSLGYDEDDNEHYEVNVNGKVITILEEPDRTLHAQGGSIAKNLFDQHYDEIKDVIQSYLQTRGTGNAASDEANEFDDKERRGDANGRWSDKCTGRSHRDNQGDDEDAEEKKHNWKTCSCEKCKRARYIADHVDKDEWPNNMKESAQITNFIKAISQKNYAQADKYLQGTIDSKLKASINKAIQNSK